MFQRNSKCSPQTQLFSTATLTNYHRGSDIKTTHSFTYNFYLLKVHWRSHWDEMKSILPNARERHLCLEFGLLEATGVPSLIVPLFFKLARLQFCDCCSLIWYLLKDSKKGSSHWRVPIRCTWLISDTLFPCLNAYAVFRFPCKVTAWVQGAGARMSWGSSACDGFTFCQSHLGDLWFVKHTCILYCIGKRQNFSSLHCFPL